MERLSALPNTKIKLPDLTVVLLLLYKSNINTLEWHYKAALYIMNFYKNKLREYQQLV